MKKDYRVIIVVGRRGAGKSTFIKNVLINNYSGNIVVYDPRNEYKGGTFMHHKKFFEMVRNLRSSLIIFEEATMYISNKSDIEDLRFLLVGARHEANTIVLVFHTLQAVPMNIFSEADLAVIFKTNDNWGYMSRKYSGNYDFFDKVLNVNDSPLEHSKVLIPLR